MDPLPLPDGITSSYVDCTDSCGLKFHVLEAGKRSQPLILFCHGFPEISYSWRKILLQIADSTQSYCVAMDQRGFGRTTGWDTRSFHECDMNQWNISNLVRDMVCLVYKLGYTEVKSIVGHDAGAVTSAHAALIRPDIFKSTVQISHPFKAPASPPSKDKPAKTNVDIQADLAKLNPPRKHYKWYNSTPEAIDDWNNPSQGLEEYLRSYFYLKSADWAKNDPHPLKDWSAEGLQELPEYYIMRLEHSFPKCIASNMVGEDYSKTHEWLPEEELAVYCKEWRRTGFEGALRWYRMLTNPENTKEMFLFKSQLTVPCTFISGRADWGNYQQPGAIEGYESENAVKLGCFKKATFIDGAGHWVAQEQPKAVTDALLNFLLGV